MNASFHHYISHTHHTRLCDASAEVCSRIDGYIWEMPGNFNRERKNINKRTTDFPVQKGKIKCEERKEKYDISRARKLNVNKIEFLFSPDDINNI